MGASWWVLFTFNILLAIGLLSTYFSKRDYLKDPARRVDESPRPTALVILPVKGIDYEMEKNFLSIQSQDYSSYDILSVVDDESDPSIEILKKLNVNYIVSDSTCRRCSGKVKAIHSALSNYRDYKYYAVADSDIRVKPNWLSSLLKPLSDPEVGVTTTFPVFYPRAGFWSKLKMYWGLVGQSMMESKLTRFVWGGSMCFRRDILDDASLSQFSNSISDDVAILRIVKGKGLRVVYVPNAQPEVHSIDNFSIFKEWSIRQTALSIDSSRRVFSFGMLYYLVSVYLLLSSVILGAFHDFQFLIFLIPFVFSSISSFRKLPIKVPYFLLITFVLQFVYLANLVTGLASKKITWRGTSYTLRHD